MRLKNKTALITAAGQGIGRATALLFANEGATIYATDINDDALASLAKEHENIHTHHLDVTDKQAIIDLAQRIDKLDVLFNCAGFVHNGTILDATDKEWDLGFDLNVKAMFHMNQTFIPVMLKNGGGDIINMSSVASSVKGAPNRFIYGTTKAAVIGMTKAIAADFISQGIRCNAICPGTVQTPSLDDRIATQGTDPEQERKKFIARQPIGRVGTAKEIAALVLYFASDESNYTTGTASIIDGGWSN